MVRSSRAGFVRSTPIAQAHCAYTVRVKSLPTWLSYTALRILLFVLPLAVLLIAGIDPFLSAAIAALFGLSASILFLRHGRESVAKSLYEARRRERAPVTDDDAAEDAAVDGTDASNDAGGTR